MSNNKTNPNESAFPEVQPMPQFNNHTYGLTKREYFAAMAMQGILSSRGLQEALNNDRIKWETCAVETADELIKELNK